MQTGAGKGLAGRNRRASRECIVRRVYAEKNAANGTLPACFAVVQSYAGITAYDVYAGNRPRCTGMDGQGGVGRG